MSNDLEIVRDSDKRVPVIRVTINIAIPAATIGAVIGAVTYFLTTVASCN